MMNFCAAVGAWGHGEDRGRGHGEEGNRESEADESADSCKGQWHGICSQSLPPSGNTENLHHFVRCFSFVDGAL